MEPSTKTQGKSRSFPLGLTATLLIGIIGYQRYVKFTDFIDTIRFEVTITQNNQDEMQTRISPVSRFGIPYKIRSIELVLENQIWRTEQCDLHKKIVLNSHIPITIHAVGAMTKTTDPLIMAVTYSFYGFSIKRGYTPQITRTSNHARPMFEQKQSTAAKKPCSCKNTF